jgi:L-asparaginase II
VTPPPDVRWSTLFHNCSGKHCGFLACCRLHRESFANYLDSESPVQRRSRQALQAEVGNSELVHGIDGCSAPNYAMPLAQLARLFARLAVGATPALEALRFAMTRHPDLVSGTGRMDLALMQIGNGDWVTKIGADGVQAIGIRSRGIGIALRIADGNPRARHAATVEVVQQLGLVDDPMSTPLARFTRPVLRNLNGIAVGRVEPVFSLPTLASLLG